MARPTSWLPRLADIFRSVENSVRTHYDRDALEKLFQIQARAAGKLMDMLPKVEALGRSHLVERQALRSFLEAVRESPDKEAYLASRRSTPAPVSRRKPRLLVRKDVLDEGSLDSLPGTVTIEPGRLEIRFADLQQFTDGMAAIAGALECHLEEFIQRFVPVSPEQQRARDEEHEVQLELQRFDEQFKSWLATKRATMDSGSTKPVSSLGFPPHPSKSLSLRQKN